MISSKVENQLDKQWDLKKLQDIKPIYQRNLCIFECNFRQREETKTYQEFMNGDNKFSSEDQIAIVLRKIYFYLEILILFHKRFHQKYTKIKLMFEQESFYESMLMLVDLSTLITKNRGINYKKSINQDFEKLQALIGKYKDEITDFHYDQDRGFNKN